MKLDPISEAKFEQEELEKVLPELIDMAEYDMDQCNDPYAMYIIVNNDLNMGRGKIASQCSHASEMLYIEYIRLQEKLIDITHKTPHDDCFPLIIKLNKFKNYLYGLHRKIVLSGTRKEIDSLKNEYRDNFVEVIDHGLTEVPENSLTTLALWPQNKSQRTVLLKGLQSLK